MPMSERLMKGTHGILAEGLDAEDAVAFDLQSFGGTYRHGKLMPACMSTPDQQTFRKP